jgi:hypothetical protein
VRKHKAKIHWSWMSEREIDRGVCYVTPGAAINLLIAATLENIHSPRRRKFNSALVNARVYTRRDITMKRRGIMHFRYILVKRAQKSNLNNKIPVHNKKDTRRHII